MAIKGGQILHQAGKYVLDRIQTGGPGELNIPEEKIYELGNYESIATIRDIPEISFDLESYDTTCEFESILINKAGAAPAGVAAGLGGSDANALSGIVGSNEVDFKTAVPIDIISPWKSRRGSFDVVKGVVMPYLTLENVSYRFGVGENSTQSFTMRGDSIFYTPEQPFTEEFDFSSGPSFTLSSGRTATVYTDGLDSIYVLSVTLCDSTSNAYKRVFYDSTGSGVSYTNTSTGFTLSAGANALTGYDTVKITYGSADSGSYTQMGDNPHTEPVHENVSVKPAAVRGKDIEIWIGTAGATPTWEKLNSVQNVEVTWSANLENDEELGNERYVSTEYDVPDVSGSIGVKPFDPADLFKKVSQATGVSESEVIGPNVTQAVPIEIRIKHPDTGARLKTLYIPDCRFNVPGYSGQANTTLETSMSFTSDGGTLLIYNGKRVN